ncbi:hypothetical protein Nepgr_002700 [Nepenthes gracilis]|uniref:Uncharacterized protein n=1 Tax=Nepenthes gracilis TaxID=150966 RepID=A0AAD3RYF2_NEPGR|nr:hypothetical protein Nepgr_002700 [Nepenthes gracilis]
MDFFVQSTLARDRRVFDALWYDMVMLILMWVAAMREFTLLLIAASDEFLDSIVDAPESLNLQFILCGWMAVGTFDGLWAVGAAVFDAHGRLLVALDNSGCCVGCYFGRSGPGTVGLIDAVATAFLILLRLLWVLNSGRACTLLALEWPFCYQWGCWNASTSLCNHLMVADDGLGCLLEWLMVENADIILIGAAGTWSSSFSGGRGKWNVLHAFICLRIHSRLSLLGEDCSWKLDAAASGWLIFGEGQFAEMVGFWVALVGLGMLMSLRYGAVGLFVCCDVVDVIPLTLSSCGVALFAS